MSRRRYRSFTSYDGRSQAEESQDDNEAYLIMGFQSPFIYPSTTHLPRLGYICIELGKSPPDGVCANYRNISAIAHICNFCAEFMIEIYCFELTKQQNGWGLRSQ